MAGGTGGHVFPALAVAEDLRARGCDVSWLGTRQGIESEQVPAHNFPITYISVAGLRGKGGLAKIRGVARLVLAAGQALRAVYKLKPDVVLGLGGFASGPGGVAARLLGKPLVIHEQNAIAGTTNRLLSKIASVALTAFPEALPGARHCGNPVRAEILKLSMELSQRSLEESLLEESSLNENAAKPRLLVLGGSLGAQKLNQTLPEALALMAESQRPEVRHQCGRGNEETTKNMYQQAGVDADVVPFVADMAAAYTWADFVVCRAGALTVSELTAVGLPSILVPFPYAIDDHQTHNALWLVNAGAGYLLDEKALNPESLAATVLELTTNTDKRAGMAESARRLALPDATRRVADVCLEVAA
ncbi:MAG: undecaprenyldiphospho-muramoylpentapeptide beta-N-acetylglucosaminyltransferase [Porticoccaceae bacterium]|nr:undecaprenyldiphospho-muramoylpentapeptide beta-N-acetylglucosaminyltransferase [Porticoccaceae bacterium]